MKVLHDYQECTLAMEQNNPFCPFCGKPLLSIFKHDGSRLICAERDKLFFCVFDSIFWYNDVISWSLKRLKEGEWGLHAQEE